MVVKSATKKKLMDLGIEEKYAHLLADDKKWTDIKELTTGQIQVIISSAWDGTWNPYNTEIAPVAEEIKVKIGIEEKYAHLLADDKKWLEVQQEIVELLEDVANIEIEDDEELVITLTSSQVSFLKTYDSKGPDDEPFLDPNWKHCHDHSCGHCPKHALHHGIPHEAWNPDSKQMTIWQQCLEQFGEEDYNGTKINVAMLYAYSANQDFYHQGKKVTFNPIVPYPKTKEKKAMKTIVGSKKRAEIILKAVERFDVSWSERGEDGFYNTLRVSPAYLEQFITVLLENLLKKEAMDVFRRGMITLGIPWSLNEHMIVEYYNSIRDERQEITNKLTQIFAQAINDKIDDSLESGADMGHVHKFATNMGKARKGLNPRQVLDYYLASKYQTSLIDVPFVKAYLTYDNDEGTTLPISQKARGIHSIGRNTTGLRMFNKLPSLHISLNVALFSTNRELIISIARTWQGKRVESILANGLYIRTCPATPRPGALPNVLAKTPKQFLDGVRMLGDCMTNPDHVDYDPDGCLIVQQYIKPVCSAVVVKGSDTFTIGPSNDGVTAGGGSNIVFTLNKSGQRDLSQDIKRLELDDGMEHHEIELVYDSSGILQKPLAWFRAIADQRHRGKEGRIKPTITQMRGLHTAKADLVPPPMVNGKSLYIRGNVPMGVVEQLTVMDVGQGSLDECLELEQMAKNGELPEGLVVYAPSGTNAAHVAGVGLDFHFPVIYGIKPARNGTIWTEIEGWVTDQPGAEPQPYDPTPFMDFYKIGLRDGDRFWTYNLAPLSQFFHNYISGPVNDPRLEAYLAGVFTTWIIKAAIGVSMAEFRHGIGSSRAEISPQRAFSHILIQQSISSESGVGNLFDRGEYYQRLNYKELGYDLIHSLSDFYSDAYDDCIVEWCDGSFGGQKYYNSTYPTRDASSLILKLLQGRDVDLKSILASVNKLENAVHNTGFFFNKFLGDKGAFDIGTSGHRDFSSASEHWLVTAPFYALFYINYVDEPHRVAKGHDKLVVHLMQMVVGRKVNQDMVDEMPKFLSLANWQDTLKEDIKKRGLGHHEHFFVEQLEADYTMHKTGLCGFDECKSAECQRTSALVKMGIDLDTLNKLMGELKKFMTSSPFSFPHKPDTLEMVTDALTAQGGRAVSQTAFTKTTRKVETPEVTVTKLSDDFEAYLIEPNNSEVGFVYIDPILRDWWYDVEDVVAELQECSPIDQYYAWRNPEEWVGENIMDEVKKLEEIILNKLGYIGDGHSSIKLYSRYWNTSHHGFSTPTKIMQCMMVGHEGRYHYNTHSLLQKLHGAGKINETKGEIK